MPGRKLRLAVDLSKFGAVRNFPGSVFVTSAKSDERANPDGLRL